MSCKTVVLKSALLLLSLCIIICSFACCGREEPSSNMYRSVKGAVMESQVLASNSEYELSWDSMGNAVILKSLQGGEYWSDILYDSFLEGSTSSNGNSPITITVANTKSLKWDTVPSYSEIGSDGNILCKKIENGIRVTYFFDAYKIAIPVDYVLNKDSLTVTVDSSKILEDGVDHKLIAVSLVPYLCSVKNDAQNGSLFVPSGTGAVMYAAETPDGIRKYTGEVYGTDAARRVPINLVDSETIKLPVFGAYGNGKGLMGIIEQGTGSVEITAQAGNDKLGYSNIGATLYVRGYDDFIYTYHGQHKGVTRRVNKDISGQKLSVTYYPLYGEQASYSGIAEKYRSYLIGKGELEDKKEQSGAYAVTFLGGTNITKSIFGIPVQKLTPLTTFSQASEIINSLNEKVGKVAYVRMSGYGDKGIRAGSVAGGKKYASAFGSKKELESLIKSFKDNKLFFDYDIVYFSESGSGFSLNFDVAKTSILHKAEHFPVSTLRTNDKDNPYYTIARDRLQDAAALAFDKSEKYGIKNISFSSLGYSAFSDFSDNSYINKNGIERAVKNIAKESAEKGNTTAFANANSYAACAADVLFDTSLTNGNFDTFDLEIPFYQMVFHSYKPLYSSALNLADNTSMATAKAIAYGMGLGYTLTNGYVDNSDDLDEFRLYGTVYSDNSDLIYNTLVEKGYYDMYSEISDAALISYEINDASVSKSVFDNGKVIYVNQSSKGAECPEGRLEPYGFCMSKE